MDPKQAAKELLEAHTKLREIAHDLAPFEKQHLSLDGLGSAGMEADGVLDQYTAGSKERADLAAEIQRLRTEVGDASILKELQNLEGAESAIQYIRQSPRENSGKDEAKQETRRGWFGRFR